MKLLGFNAWKCKIDRQQELQKQEADRTLSDSEEPVEAGDVEDETCDLSAENSDDSIDEVTENLEDTILDSDAASSQSSEQNSSQAENSQQAESDVDTSSASEINSSDLSDASTDMDIDIDFDNVKEDDGDELVMKDDDGNVLFDSGKDGLMSSARWFSRLMMASSLFSQRTLIRKFAKLHPECELLQKLLTIIKTDSFKKKCKTFVKFSVLHLNYSAFIYDQF